MSAALNRLKKAVAKGDKAKVQAILDEMSLHEKDLLVECRARDCGAKEFEECVGTKPGEVHFCRRLSRLLKGIR